MLTRIPPARLLPLAERNLPQLLFAFQLPPDNRLSKPILKIYA